MNKLVAVCGLALLVLTSAVAVAGVVQPPPFPGPGVVQPPPFPGPGVVQPPPFPGPRA
jgi:hypothetical protein